jgi:hypothetical protein
MSEHDEKPPVEVDEEPGEQDEPEGGQDREATILPSVDEPPDDDEAVD